MECVAVYICREEGSERDEWEERVHPWAMGKTRGREATSKAPQIQRYQACFEGNPFKIVPDSFKLFCQCMRSKLGEEPKKPYTYLQFNLPKREVKLE